MISTREIATWFDSAIQLSEQVIDMLHQDEPDLDIIQTKFDEREEFLGKLLQASKQTRDDADNILSERYQKLLAADQTMRKLVDERLKRVGDQVHKASADQHAHRSYHKRQSADNSVFISKLNG